MKQQQPCQQQPACQQQPGQQQRNRPTAKCNTSLCVSRDTSSVYKNGHAEALRCLIASGFKEGRLSYTSHRIPCKPPSWIRYRRRSDLVTQHIRLRRKRNYELVLCPEHRFPNQPQRQPCENETDYLRRRLRRDVAFDTESHALLRRIITSFRLDDLAFMHNYSIAIDAYHSSRLKWNMLPEPVQDAILAVCVVYTPGTDLTDPVIACRCCNFKASEHFGEWYTYRCFLISNSKSFFDHDRLELTSGPRTRKSKIGYYFFESVARICKRAASGNTYSEETQLWEGYDRKKHFKQWAKNARLMIRCERDTRRHANRIRVMDPCLSDSLFFHLMAPHDDQDFECEDQEYDEDQEEEEEEEEFYDNDDDNEKGDRTDEKDELVERWNMASDDCDKKDGEDNHPSSYTSLVEGLITTLKRLLLNSQPADLTSPHIRDVMDTQPCDEHPIQTDLSNWTKEVQTRYPHLY